MSKPLQQVLIVDDAATVRLYYSSILEKAGYVVDQALNGIEALEKILVNTYDLLLVDVNMPKQDGFVFLQAVRRLEGAQPPAVMISTEAGKNDRLEAFRSGANYYVVKPVKPDELLALCRVLTGQEKEK